MASVTNWNPFGVALNVTATSGTVTRISATQYTVVINASWAVYYSGNTTNYGMTATSGGVTQTISAFDGTYRSGGSSSFTGTYTISGNGAATKTIKVTFTNFKTDNGDSATKKVYLNVTVPALTYYTVSFDANGGTNAPASQTKWKDQTLTLSSSKPTLNGYTFLGWSANSNATTATYTAGGSYTANASATLYAVWKANTYTVTYNANGGTLGDVSTQTKTHDEALTLTGTATRTNYIFKGWGVSASATAAAYATGASYTQNANITLYAVWELAYSKPRITDVLLCRAVKNDDGTYTESDEGNYIQASFSWECDGTDPTAQLARKVVSETEWITSDVYTIDSSGTETWYFGSGTIDPEKSYNLKIIVTDSGGSTTRVATIQSTEFVIDCLKKSSDDELSGIAFGKAAELRGVAEFAYVAKFSNGIENEVLEKDGGVDLDDITEPNTYVSVNKSASYYKNCPVSSGTFTLEVKSAGAEGQLIQRITTTFKNGLHQVYVRHFFSSAWGKWILIFDGSNETYYGKSITVGSNTVETLIRDTGWRDLTFNSGYSVGSEMGYLKGRIKNGVLHIKGDILGVGANWVTPAQLPDDILPSGLADSNRIIATYNVSYFCAINLRAAGALTVCSNNSGAWDSSKNISINTAICL